MPKGRSRPEKKARKVHPFQVTDDEVWQHNRAIEDSWGDPIVITPGLIKWAQDDDDKRASVQSPQTWWESHVILSPSRKPIPGDVISLRYDSLTMYYELVEVTRKNFHLRPIRRGVETGVMELARRKAKVLGVVENPSIVLANYDPIADLREQLQRIERERRPSRGRRASEKESA